MTLRRMPTSCAPAVGDSSIEKCHNIVTTISRLQYRQLEMAMEKNMPPTFQMHRRCFFVISSIFIRALHRFFHLMRNIVKAWCTAHGGQYNGNMCRVFSSKGHTFCWFWADALTLLPLGCLHCMFSLQFAKPFPLTHCALNFLLCWTPWDTLAPPRPSNPVMKHAVQILHVGSGGYRHLRVWQSWPGCCCVPVASVVPLNRRISRALSWFACWLCQVNGMEWAKVPAGWWWLVPQLLHSAESITWLGCVNNDGPQTSPNCCCSIQANCNDTCLGSSGMITIHGDKNMIFTVLSRLYLCVWVDVIVCFLFKLFWFVSCSLCIIKWHSIADQDPQSPRHHMFCTLTLDCAGAAFISAPGQCPGPGLSSKSHKMLKEIKNEMKIGKTVCTSWSNSWGVYDFSSKQLVA